MIIGKVMSILILSLIPITLYTIYINVKTVLYLKKTNPDSKVVKTMFEWWNWMYKDYKEDDEYIKNNKTKMRRLAKLSKNIFVSFIILFIVIILTEVIQ
jgi:hypothetical protein